MCEVVSKTLLLKNTVFPKKHCFPKKPLFSNFCTFLSHCFETKTYHCISAIFFFRYIDIIDTQNAVLMTALIACEMRKSLLIIKVMKGKALTKNRLHWTITAPYYIIVKLFCRVPRDHDSIVYI